MVTVYLLSYFSVLVFVVLSSLPQIITHFLYVLLKKGKTLFHLKLVFFTNEHQLFDTGHYTNNQLAEQEDIL